MKKKLFSIVILLSVFLSSFLPTNASSQVVSSPEQNLEEVAPQRVSFLATGDNLIHGAIYMQALQRGNGNYYDFDFLYENISDFMHGYDLCYINQETLINSTYAPSTYPRFSSPPELGLTLYNLGFRVFSISNNHTYDLGAGGIDATLEYWNSMPNDIYLTGLYTNYTNYYNIPIYEMNGITFAFLAYTEHTNGLPTPYNSNAYVVYTSEEEILERQIRFANTLADVVVIIPHWGVEGTHTVSEAQRALANKMCIWGADVILGSHPHVLQEIEWLENNETGNRTLVIYSLGNFASAQSAPDNLIGGFFTFDIIKDNMYINFENVSFYPLITHYGYNYSNITVYPYSEYSNNLAINHGIRDNYPIFSLEYIDLVLKNTIDKEFLVV